MMVKRGEWAKQNHVPKIHEGHGRKMYNEAG